jgi:hypothetical protein
MSTTLLIADLEEANVNNIEGINSLIAEAKSGLFHDFQTTEATPKILLISRLKKLGLETIAKYAMEGKYDDDI